MLILLVSYLQYYTTAQSTHQRDRIPVGLCNLPFIQKHACFSLNMSTVFGAALLALVGCSTAQLTGRGFPNCNSAPLKNNKVCDTSLGVPFPPSAIHILVAHSDDQILLHVPLLSSMPSLRRRNLTIPAMSAQEYLDLVYRHTPGGKKHYTAWQSHPV